jgi:hypothetical protein
MVFESHRMCRNKFANIYGARVLLQKVTTAKLVIKFHAFYATRIFITMLVIALPNPYPETEESSPYPLNLFFQDTF